MGRRLPDRRGAGGDRGPRAGRRLPPDRVRARGRGGIDRDRDVPAGADPRVRRARRAPRRRAVRGSRGHAGVHAAVPGSGPDRGARARGPGERNGRGDDLHLRGRDRRGLVEGARAPDEGRGAEGRIDRAVALGTRGVGLARRGGGDGGAGRDRRHVHEEGAPPDHRAARRRRGTAG